MCVCVCVCVYICAQHPTDNGYMLIGSFIYGCQKWILNAITLITAY